jgi:membrane-bound lytic murein transglycosylase D
MRIQASIRAGIAALSFLAAVAAVPAHAALGAPPPALGPMLAAPSPYADPEVCTGLQAAPFDETLALLVRLKAVDGFCDSAFAAEAVPTEEEICKFDGLGAFDFDEYELPMDMEPVLVSLQLNSYRMDDRAERIVSRVIKTYTTDIPERFKLYLGRSARYIRLMKNILREEGVPEDMAWLPLIESGFNTHAYSSSKAAGPWQFIAGTGKRYGLKINWWVDERRDPVKSTRAAARYLKDLYGMFDSWSLAMAGYNAGENRIKRALKRTGSDDYWSLLSTRYIRTETKYYVPKFIASRLIATDPVKYGLTDIAYEEDFTYDEVEIGYSMSLDVIARSAGTTVKVIQDLNPELRRFFTPPVKGYKLRIPRGSTEQFLASAPLLPSGKPGNVTPYTVRRGDTVSAIAKRHGVPMDLIISFNQLGSRALIRPGQMLMIPIASR